jgi:hypothetical protein
MEAPITPTADRTPAELGNFAAPFLRKIAAPLTLLAPDVIGRFANPHLQANSVTAVGKRPGCDRAQTLDTEKPAELLIRD